MPPLFSEGNNGKKNGLHRRLEESASSRGMTLEIHEDSSHLGGSGNDLVSMFVGLTMKEIVILSLIFILFLKFTLVPWLNVIGSEAWASARQELSSESVDTNVFNPGVCQGSVATSASLVIIGTGGVGQELIMKLSSSQHLRDSENPGGLLGVFGVFDSSGGFLVNSKGTGKPLDRGLLRAIVRAKKAGSSLSEVRTSNAFSNVSFSPNSTHGLDSLVVSFGVGGASYGRPLILVDVTADATEAHSSLLSKTLKSIPKSGLVLANKAPLCSSQVPEIAKLAFQSKVMYEKAPSSSMIDNTDRFSNRIRFEATVGAGLPVIRTLQDLVRSGDTIHRVEGMFSGTASFLLSEIRRGTSKGIADALDAAVSKGLTEPNPCIDVSGIDVARKALIIARLMAEDVNAITMEDIVARPLASCSFEGASPVIGNEASLMSKGGVTQYAATIEAGSPVSANVGPSPFPPSHPFSHGLNGAESRGIPGPHGSPDNVIIVHTLLYKESPLIIRGPGAGIGVTASAVMSDIIQLTADLL